MNTGFMISASDEDVSMRTGWEEILKIESYIICIVEQQQPLFMVLLKPLNCVTSRFTYLFG
jgi:hypothetical protein